VGYKRHFGGLNPAPSHG